MFDNLINDLVAGKRLEPCVFCKQKPRFVQWEGRALVIFKHTCKFVTYESVCFPAKADEVISEWNAAIDAVYSKEPIIKTNNDNTLNDLLAAAKLSLSLMKRFFLTKEGTGTIKQLERAIGKAEGCNE
jgi:hypothetical protein